MRFLIFISVLLFSTLSLAKYDGLEGVIYTGKLSFDYSFEVEFEGKGILPPSDAQVENAFYSAPRRHAYSELLQRLERFHVSLLNYQIQVNPRKEVKLGLGLSDSAYVSYDTKVEATVLSFVETPLTPERITSATISLLTKKEVINTNLSLESIEVNLGNSDFPIILSKDAKSQIKRTFLSDKKVFPEFGMNIDLMSRGKKVGAISYENAQVKSLISLSNSALFMRACENFLRRLSDSISLQSFGPPLP